MLCKRLSFRRNKYASTNYDNSRDTGNNQISEHSNDKINRKLTYITETIRLLNLFEFSQLFHPHLKISNYRERFFIVFVVVLFRWRSDKTSGEFGDLATSWTFSNSEAPMEHQRGKLVNDYF